MLSRDPEQHNTFESSPSAENDGDFEDHHFETKAPPSLHDIQEQTDQNLTLKKDEVNNDDAHTQQKQQNQSSKLNDRQLDTSLDLAHQKTEEGLYKDSCHAIESQSTCQSTDLDDLEETHLPPDLDPELVNKYFKVLFAAILIMSIDLGILPACTIKMQQELGIDNAQFGLLGSVVYLGQTFGAVMSSILLQKVPPKIFLFICIVCNMLSLVYFTITDDFSNLLICRMFTGLFQIFFGVYQPVWADTFGNEQQKAIWISYLIIATPLGTIIGYLMAAIFQDNIGWRFVFYIQALLLLPSTVYIILIPRKYQDVTITGQYIKQHQRMQARRRFEMNERISQQEYDDEKPNSPTSEQNNKLKDSQEGHIKPPDVNSQPLDDFDSLKIPFLTGLKLVFQNKEFGFMCGSITCLYFVVTGIQFWFSDYMITEMGVDKSVVFTWFGIVSITGPILGVFVGGKITTALGGYTSMSNLYSIMTMALFSIAFALPIPFMKPGQTVPIVGLLWLELFAGGYMLPSMTGMMLNTVDQQLKTSANSVANTCYNIFGFLPAPIIFGYISDIGPKVGGNKKAAMMHLMTMPIVSVTFAFFAFYFLRKKGFGTKAYLN